MMSPFVPPVDSRQQFAHLLELALRGESPPTESGLADDVVDALMDVAWKRTPESAANAQSVYESSI